MAIGEEFPDSEELIRLRSENKSFEKACFAGRLSCFRADVAMRFRLLDPRQPNGSWMYFDLDNTPGAEPGVSTDLLIHVRVLPSPIHGSEVSRPYIRMLKSEKYTTPGAVEYLTTDVTVDNEDDAQYLIGSFPIVDGSSKFGTENSTVPFFFVNTDGLFVSANYEAFTPLIGVYCDEGNSQEVISPFGDYKNLRDKSDALDVANQLLFQAQNLEPIAVSS